MHLKQKGERNMLESYNEILTVTDLYNILPIGRNGVYKLLNSGQIKSIRIGKKIFVLKEALVEYLRSA